MINQICYDFQSVFSYSTISGKVLIISLFLYIFLILSIDDKKKKPTRIIGVNFIIIYVIMFMCTQLGNSVFGSDGIGAKVLCFIQLLCIILVYALPLISRIRAKLSSND